MTSQICDYYDLPADDENIHKFPKKVTILHIHQANNKKSFMNKINHALDNMNYTYCTINIPDLTGLCVKKKIKCAQLITNTLNAELIYYFDISHFREIKSDNILCPLEGLFYCNVNKKLSADEDNLAIFLINKYSRKYVYDYLANYDFIEGLKIIKERIGNEDVLFEIFKHEYSDFKMEQRSKRIWARELTLSMLYAVQRASFN
jgi:hypothetical protein